MKADCHIHMVLDGVDWKAAIASHQPAPDEEKIRAALEDYCQQGYTYLRDGGDRWGVGAKARELAVQCGIVYRTPLEPLCLQGHYGAFIGTSYEDLRQYAQHVRRIRETGGDFIKIMISGLMDFDRYGVLTQEGLPAEMIRELIHIAHEEGMTVMAHANGARTVEAAAVSGIDSVEHGAYLDAEALHAMQEAGAVWVPTLSTVANLRGKGRFDEYAVCRILENTMENVCAFSKIGGLVAPGTDAGAWSVPHRAHTEERLLSEAGVPENTMQEAIARIMDKF